MARGLLAITLLLFTVPSATYAQNPTGRLILTVNDTTGGSLPMATVTVTGLDPANRELKIPPQQTTESGIVTIDLALAAIRWWRSSAASRRRSRARSACVPATTG